jgi:5'-methylthioadenosine phosphorylase
MTSPIRIGVIGGSGVYHIEHLTDIEEVRVDTPFGEPSDAYIVGTIEGQRVAFLPATGAATASAPAGSTIAPTSSASSCWAWNT